MENSGNNNTNEMFDGVWGVLNVPSSQEIMAALSEVTDNFGMLVSESAADSTTQDLLFADLNDLQVPHTAFVQQNTVTTTDEVQPMEQGYRSSSLPANNNWSGEYGFNISFGENERRVTKKNWTYSELKDKLYVPINTPCPINFHTEKTPPSGSIIRAMMIYASPAHAEHIVQRCFHHANGADNQGHPAPANHLVRCESPHAQYSTDAATLRHVVTVPYESPEEGMAYTTYLYKFMCLTSCVGGLNRRPTQIIFSLYLNNQCLGRRTLEVRICACPLRDKRNEEEAYQKHMEALKRTDWSGVTNSKADTKSRKQKLSHEPQETKVSKKKQRMNTGEANGECSPNCVEAFMELKRNIQSAFNAINAAVDAAIAKHAIHCESSLKKETTSSDESD